MRLSFGRYIPNLVEVCFKLGITKQTNQAVIVNFKHTYPRLNIYLPGVLTPDI